MTVEKKVYKIFKMTQTNDREMQHFNDSFDGYDFEGIGQHGAAIVIVGSRMEEVVEKPELEVVDVVPEVTPVGTFSDEVDEIESKQDSQKPAKVVDPFRT
ncbi:MAG: hypothetical protein GQ524_01995 [Anaerolineales bacterium]|nr:hypothetical protein [Anaerolineales bacterium]